MSRAAHSRSLPLLVLIGFLVASASFVYFVARAQSVSAGQSSSAVLESSGTLAVWGYNGFGQLGDGTNTQRTLPIELSGTWQAVSLGSNHTLALKPDGTVWAWGYNGYGQLGDGTSTGRNTPQPVSGLTGVIAIASGDSHSVAVKSDGTVWAWGYNGYGQLGDGTTTNRWLPVQVGGVSGATTVAAGTSHTLIGTPDGVFAVGYNGFGQLGDGTNTSRTTPVAVPGVPSPTVLAAGSGHSLAVTADGSVWAWGYNGYGQLGDGTNTSRVTAVRLSGVSGVARISTSDHVLALKSDGTVWAWGYNGYGQLGDGTTTARNSPAQVQGLSAIVSVAAGSTHSLAVTSSGVVYSWGNNTSAQLGNGTTNTSGIPAAISAGNYVWKVGQPQISPGSGTYFYAPNVTVTCATPGATIYYTLDGTEPSGSSSSLATGATISITQTQTLKALASKPGSPASDTVSATYVTKVPPPSPAPYPSTYTSAQTVTLLDITPGATIRYTLDGTAPASSSPVYSSPLGISTQTILEAYASKPGWEDSDLFTGTYSFNYGTLSPPTISPVPGSYTAPLSVTIECSAGATLRYTTDNTNPVETSSAYSGPLVLTATTTIESACFQLDHQTSAIVTSTYTLQAASPTLSLPSGQYPAGTQVTVTSPTAGAVLYFTLDGTDPTPSSAIVASGSSLVLGDFTLKVKAVKTGLVDSPISSGTYTIAGAVTQFAVAAGVSSAYALGKDGTVWAWGSNVNGELGDGTTTNRLIPGRVQGLTGIKEIVAFERAAYALGQDGTVWGWGTAVNSSTPAQTIPKKVEGLSDITQLAAGWLHLLALKTDGTVWAAGSNSFGQLGDGTSNPHSAPIQVPGLTGITSVGAGAHSSFAVKGGMIYAWGYNPYNQLGLNTQTQVIYSPTLVSAAVGVAQVHGGFDGLYAEYTLVLGFDGSVAFIGYNQNFYLSGQDLYSAIPVPVAGLSKIADLSTARYVGAALATDGTVLTWGGPFLGDGTDQPEPTPRTVQGLPPVVGVATSGLNSVAVTASGILYTWGISTATGTGSTQNALSPVGVSGPNLDWGVATPSLSLPPGTYNVPITVTATCATPGAEIHYTTDGSDPTLSDPIWPSTTPRTVDRPVTYRLKGFLTGVSDSNTATYGFGFTPYVPDFTPGTGYVFTSPITVTISEGTAGAEVRYTVDGSDPSPTSTLYAGPIALNTYTTLKATAFRNDWEPSATRTAVYAFNLGTLSAPVLTPAPGTYEGHVDVTISGDPRGTLRFTVDGSEPSASSSIYAGPISIDGTTTLKAYSFNPDYAPGKTSGVYRIKVAAPILDPPGGQYPAGQDIRLTDATSGALIRYQQGAPPLTSTAAKVRSGQSIPAGNFTLTAQATKTGCDPSDLVSQSYTTTGTLADSGARLALGAGFGLFLDVYGRVYSWGEGSSGQLGDGTLAARQTPQLVSDSFSFAEVAAGGNHAVAIARDGTLWTWGDNSEGQLGLGDFEMRTEPTLVPGLSAVRAIAAGAGTTYAVLADGSLFSWGSNGRGELGNGSSGHSSSTPGRVLALTQVMAIAAGQHHVLAITGSGALYSWGGNESGQLGDGSTTDRTSPTAIIQGTAFTAAAAGDTHSVVVTTSGTVLSFGDNSRGELGNGTRGGVFSTPAPVQVTDGTGPIAAGQGFTLICSAGGICVGFGADDYGQLSFVGPDQPTPTTIQTLSGVVHIAAAGNVAAAVDSRGQLKRWGGAQRAPPEPDLDLSRATLAIKQPIITGRAGGQEYLWWDDEVTITATNLDPQDPHLTVGQFPGYAVQATRVKDTNRGEFLATFKVPYDTRGGRFLYLSSRGRSTPIGDDMVPLNISPPVTYSGIISVVGTTWKFPKKPGHVFVSDNAGIHDVDLFSRPFAQTSSQPISGVSGPQLLSEVTTEGVIFFVGTATGNPDVMALDIATGAVSKWGSTKDLTGPSGAKTTFTPGAITAQRDGSTVFIWDKDTKELVAVFPDASFFTAGGEKYPLNPDAPTLVALNRDGLVAYSTGASLAFIEPLHGGPLPPPFPIVGVRGLHRGDVYYDNDPTKPNAFLYCESLACAETFNPETNRAAVVSINEERTRILLTESSMWTGRLVTDRVVVSNPQTTTDPVPYLSDAQDTDRVISMKVYAAPWQTVSLRVVDVPDTAPYVQPQATGFRFEDNKITAEAAGLGLNDNPDASFSRCLSLPPQDPTKNGDTVYQVYLRVPRDSAAGDNYRVELSPDPFNEGECAVNDLPDKPILNYSGSIEVWRQVALEIDPMYRRGAPLARRTQQGDSQVWIPKLNKNPNASPLSFNDVDNLKDGEQITIFGQDVRGGDMSEVACIAHRDPNPSNAGPDLVLLTLKDCATGKPYSLNGSYLPNYSTSNHDLLFSLVSVSGVGAQGPGPDGKGPFFQPQINGEFVDGFKGGFVEFWPINLGSGSRPLPYVDEQWFLRDNNVVGLTNFFVGTFKNYKGDPSDVREPLPPKKLPTNVWHVMAIGARSITAAKDLYGVTNRDYGLSAMMVGLIELNALSLKTDPAQLGSWGLVHELGHSFNTNACSDSHDGRLAWTSAFNAFAGEICVMPKEVPKGYGHFEVAHFCVQDLLFGDPNCSDGQGTSRSPKNGSIRGAVNKL